MANTVPPTVFVVDDDQGLLRLIQKALQRGGYAVTTAVSGKEAIAWLGANRPDLMLLDLKLRDIQGHELINQLGSLQRRVPFIVITGQGDERVAVEMMKRGALDYLVKDADFLQMVPEVVRRALEQLAREKRLIEAEAAVEKLEKEVREISEREQRRIGQELHDGLGQQLTAIELMSESLRSDLASANPNLEQQAAQVCRFLREAITQTRSLAQGLAAFKVETGGLQTALLELAQATSSVGRVKCRLDCPAPVVIDDREAAVNLYRIAQEAVNNAIKHSQATHVTIGLSKRSGVLCLKVTDNGRGFSRNGQPSDGMGLHLMKHRAGLIGGELEIQSSPGKGVTIICTLPIPI